MRDLAALDVAAGEGELKGSGGAWRRWKRAGGFEHFEPASTVLRQHPVLPLLVLVDGGRGAGDRGLDGVLDAGGRGADELDDLVDMVGHELPSPSWWMRQHTLSWAKSQRMPASGSPRTRSRVNPTNVTK